MTTMRLLMPPSFILQLKIRMQLTVLILLQSVKTLVRLIKLIKMLRITIVMLFEVSVCTVNMFFTGLCKENAIC